MHFYIRSARRGGIDGIAPHRLIKAPRDEVMRFGDRKRQPIRLCAFSGGNSLPHLRRPWYSGGNGNQVHPRLRRMSALDTFRIDARKIFDPIAARKLAIGEIVALDCVLRARYLLDSRRIIPHRLCNNAGTPLVSNTAPG